MGVIRVRSFLAHVLAAVLLLQGGALPAQSLAVSGLQAAIDGAICVAGPARPASPERRQPWAGQLCLSAHAVDQAALLPPPPAVFVATRWSPAVPPAALPAKGPVAPRAPPLQPRAPPRSA